MLNFTIEPNLLYSLKRVDVSTTYPFEDTICAFRLISVSYRSNVKEFKFVSRNLNTDCHKTAVNIGSKLVANSLMIPWSRIIVSITKRTQPLAVVDFRTAAAERHTGTIKKT